ncbi:MAG TPA: FAD-dependent oxidoreductase [Planctomycetota bacterium]|nr:FAD-dependent oxidoreductase [Planctomycetota bacterium]
MSAARIPVRLPDARYWADRVPCQMACPVLTDAGRYVQLIAEGDDRTAFLTARCPNPLASVCGRVCAAPCEDRCRRGKFDAPVAIRALKRFVTERFGVESREPFTLAALARAEAEPGNKWGGHQPILEAEARGAGKGRKVAVVGAGPAGIACAHDLALMGYAVTVLEATRRAGGMAFHGIPDFRLPPSLLDKEVQAVEAMGVAFRFESPLTRERGLSALRREGFEAVFLAVGAQRGRLMDCPGKDLDGIVKAIDYLININNGYRVPQADRVLVLGGGFVAFDAARMALRAMGAEAVEEAGGGMAPALDAARIAARAGAQVTLASLESYAEMPVTRTEQGREEYEQALEEGIRFLPQRGVRRFEGDARVRRARLIGVKRTYDEAGRFAPVFDDTVDEEIEADLVILAIGQQPELSFLAPEDGVESTPAGTIRVDPETLATTAAWVFAGGDAAFGPRNLIDAVANGKRAARGMHAYLAAKAPGAPTFRFRFEKVPTDRFARTPGYDRIRRKPPPTTDLGRRTGISEVETAYGEADARTQAERCLACHLQTIYDPLKCVLCNRCVDVCPEHCLLLVPLEEIDLPEGQLAAAREMGGAGGTVPASAMLKDDDRCIRCGLCAIRCPTDAMTMELLHYEQRS